MQEKHDRAGATFAHKNSTTFALKQTSAEPRYVGYIGHRAKRR